MTANTYCLLISDLCLYAVIVDLGVVRFWIGMDFKFSSVDLKNGKRCIWIFYMIGSVDFVVFDRVGF